MTTTTSHSNPESPRRSFPQPPTEPRALLLCGHPNGASFNHALAHAWAEGATASGAEVEYIDVGSLDFELSRSGGFDLEGTLEPDIERVQHAIARAAHIAIAYPVWWGSTPAQLKGLFDRALLPGWAFSYQEGSPIQLKGLAGRSGRLLVTMDAPHWYDRWVYGHSARKQVEKATLRFCGVKPLRSSIFPAIRDSDAKKRATMLERARADGAVDGRKLVARFASPSGVLAAGR